MISKLQLNKSSIIAKAENEKGIVLIGAIALIAILALLGTVGVVTTSTEIIISRNYKASVQASYATQAGIEEARLRLRGSLSDPNYAGDPAASPDPTWSSYILTSSSWQTSYDPDYVGTYTNYIPTTSSHTNTAIGTNTIQTAQDISYWVKIRHKREADLLPNETYTDGGSTANDIIYYGYATSTSTTLEQFTTTDPNPVMASPVEIITSYGSNGKSSS
ncbi:MAG: PilX N-terminal domain-containing pilus assembly protein, partial [Candidatus Scalinduaceae bacterium]